MPRYMDHHERFPKPQGAGLAGLRSQIEAPADEFGVKGINIIFGSDGSAQCLMDAPNAEAVLKSHQRNGVPLTRDQIAEVTTLV